MIAVSAYLMGGAIPIASADPGALDQYGGHYCAVQCTEVWDLAYNEYHFHAIPEIPQHYRGIGKHSLVALLEPTQPTITTPSTFLEPHALIENPALDVSYCMDATVFAQGWYTQEGEVRIPPVCEAFTPSVLSQGYATLPYTEGRVHTKAYPWARDYLGNAYFTDMIPLNELSGMVIQGHTDTAQYVVVPKNGGYGLKFVTNGKIEKMQNNVIRIDDSIVNGYLAR